MGTSFRFTSEWIGAMTGAGSPGFRNLDRAVSFLRNAKNSTLRMQEVRHLLRQRCHDVHRMSDDEALRQFHRMMVAGRVTMPPSLASTVRSTATGGTGVIPDTKEPEPSPEPSRRAMPRRYWVEFRVVDDETGASIEGIDLTIKLGDGSVETSSTDAGGYIEINDCPQGACELTCDFSSARLSRSYAFVRVV